MKCGCRKILHRRDAMVLTQTSPISDIVSSTPKILDSTPSKLRTPHSKINYYDQISSTNNPAYHKEIGSHIFHSMTFENFSPSCSYFTLSSKHYH